MLYNTNMSKEEIRKYIFYLAGFFEGLIFYFFVLFLTAFVVLNIPFSVEFSAGKFYLAIIPLITIVICGVVLYKFFRGNKARFYIGLLSFVIAFVLSIVIFGDIQEPRINTHNGRRAADIKQMLIALDIYYKENNIYPVIELGCQNMDLLESIITPTFVHKIPQERFISEARNPYQYAVSTDGGQFVVSATFNSNPRLIDQRHLDNDLDGNILGCDCDDPKYCLGSKNLIK